MECRDELRKGAVKPGTASNAHLQLLNRVFKVRPAMHRENDSGIICSGGSKRSALRDAQVWRTFVSCVSVPQ